MSLFLTFPIVFALVGGKGREANGGWDRFKGFLQIYQLQTENDEEETWRDLVSHFPLSFRYIERNLTRGNAIVEPRLRSVVTASNHAKRRHRRRRDVFMTPPMWHWHLISVLYKHLRIYDTRLINDYSALVEVLTLAREMESMEEY